MSSSTLPFVESVDLNEIRISLDAVEHLYDSWPDPHCIVSDGPYGVSGFPGDTHKSDSLAEWYEHHIRAWSKQATPETTLWFWSTEVGWATVHPILASYGWEYRACNIWDKGLGHIAGNSNTKTLRKFPIVTEVCVQYVKAARFKVGDEYLNMQDWLRHEWRRTGLPFRLSNEACGVTNAATRKYLTSDYLWYYPPPDAFKRLSDYANMHGYPRGRPYFSIDGEQPLSSERWSRMRAKFYCEVGVTNVWREPQVGGLERVKGKRNGMKYKYKSLHGSQKPLKLIERIIRCSTEPGDTVWEPFGGLCPGAVVSRALGRRYRAAEIIPEFYAAAVKRLENT